VEAAKRLRAGAADLVASFHPALSAEPVGNSSETDPRDGSLRGQDRLGRPEPGAASPLPRDKAPLAGADENGTLPRDWLAAESGRAGSRMPRAVGIAERRDRGAGKDGGFAGATRSTPAR
jgi:hypothetical protein